MVGWVLVAAEKSQTNEVGPVVVLSSSLFAAKDCISPARPLSHRKTRRTNPRPPGCFLCFPTRP